MTTDARSDIAARLYFRDVPTEDLSKIVSDLQKLIIQDPELRSIEFLWDTTGGPPVPDTPQLPGDTGGDAPEEDEEQLVAEMNLWTSALTGDGDVTAKRGEEFSLHLYGRCNALTSGFSVAIGYDTTALELVGFKPGATVKTKLGPLGFGFTGSEQKTEDGTPAVENYCTLGCFYRLPPAYPNPAAVVPPNSHLAVITMRVLPEATKVGESYTLDLADRRYGEHERTLIVSGFTRPPGPHEGEIIPTHSDAP